MKRSFNLSFLKNKKVSIISTKEALKDVIPIEWKMDGDKMCKSCGCGKKKKSSKKGGKKPC